MTAAHWTARDGIDCAHAQVISEASKADVVLLGEHHDHAAHHRWQLHVAAGLLAHRPILMAFEMFPARLDPVLADWVAGRLDEGTFLERAEWSNVWGFAAELYLPLFRFCREMSVPMIGLNVDRELVRKVGAQGWDAVPESEREGLSAPKPSPRAYRSFIFDLTGGARPDRAAQSADDPAFDRFLRAQEIWDRAFATRISAAIRHAQSPLVVGVIGMGHLQYGGGVSWQLADLGIENVQVLLPQDSNAPWREGAADAVFSLPPEHKTPV